MAPRVSRATLHVLSRGATLVAAIYAGVAALAGVFAWCVGIDPLSVPSWLGIAGPAAVLVSLGLGASLGAFAIATSRAMVKRVAWARALHSDLRPAVRDADDVALFALALTSGVAEEVLFRGLLLPIAGVLLSSLAFGALHQVRGRARWGWMGWATVMGFLFALVAKVSGSVTGAMLAHVMINSVNLRFLRDTDPEPKRPRGLGGLLGR